MVASYVPSAENPADAMTRVFPANTHQFLDLEPKLNADLLRKKLDHLGVMPTFDWFASDDNAQFPRFCVRSNSTRTTYTDAFSYPWNNEVGYFFPPFSLIPRVLRKIALEEATAVLIHPNWTGAAWYPQLRTMAIQTLNFPPSPLLLGYPQFPGLRHRLTNLRLQISLISSPMEAVFPTK